MKNIRNPIVDRTLYRQLVGNLIYLTHCRPSIVYIVGLVSRYKQNPQEPHWVAAKRILKYVKETPNLGLEYLHDGDVTLQGYTNANWGGDSDDQKSTTGYIFGINNGCISWQPKK